MIAVHASAALAGLFNDGPARQALRTEQLHAPHLVDSDITGGLRRRVAAGQLEDSQGWAALDAWRRLAVHSQCRPHLERAGVGAAVQCFGVRRR